MPVTMNAASTGITLLGLVAAVCTTLAFVPQVVKTWKTKSTKDISLGMFVVLVIGIVLWLVYGLSILDLPLITANAVTLLFSIIILYFKLKHG